MKLLIQSDFNCVGNVAIHCNLPKLCIAEDEAIIFDMNQLFCDFWIDIVKYWKEVDDYDKNPIGEKPLNYDLNKNLIYGETFTGCNGNTSNHLGIKRTLIYYAYSRYITINGFTDTANGGVTKTDEFTIPKTIKELEMFADKYRTMGYESYKMTLKFLCHNRDVYTDFNHKDCKKCGCECEGCKGQTKAKGYGFKSSIISR